MMSSKQVDIQAWNSEHSLSCLMDLGSGSFRSQVPPQHLPWCLLSFSRQEPKLFYWHIKHIWRAVFSGGLCISDFWRVRDQDFYSSQVRWLLEINRKEEAVSLGLLLSSSQELPGWALRLLWSILQGHPSSLLHSIIFWRPTKPSSSTTQSWRGQERPSWGKENRPEHKTGPIIWTP